MESGVNNATTGKITEMGCIEPKVCAQYRCGGCGGKVSVSPCHVCQMRALASGASLEEFCSMQGV